MDNLKNQLLKRGVDLSNLEVQILNYFVENISQISDLSIKDIADKLFVSTASITRTTQKIGFAGYREFKFFINQNIENTKVSQYSRINQEHKIQNYSNIINDSIDNLFKHIDPNKIEDAARLIYQSNSIEVISVGGSISNSIDFSRKLLTLNKKSTARIDWDELYIITKNLNPDDLAIIISLSGETEDIINYAKNLMDNSTPVLSITGSKNSTLEKITQNNILALTKPKYIGKIDMSSRVPLSIVIDYIIDTYSNLYLDENSDIKM